MDFALSGALVHLDDGLIEGLAILVEDDVIAGLVPNSEVPDHFRRHELDGGILAAGFIDVQVNGGGGVLFNEAPDVETLKAIGTAHRRYGTTGFLPTVISDRIEIIDQAMRAVEQAIAEGVPGVLGIHIEGPMLALSRHGIHDPQFMRDANAELVDMICSLRLGRTLVTVAPDVVGPKTVAQLVSAGVIVAAGHTDATYEEMLAGFAAGITGVTHLFNAMSPMANRAPGAVGGALDNESAYCGLIVDGIHVHPATLRVAMRSRPLDRFMLVSDAMPPVGTDLTSFDLQGRTILVTPDRCVDEHGTLAGSNLNMAAAVRNSVDLVGLSKPAALKIASRSPAAFLGMADKRGRIASGHAADLVWLDDALDVRETWIAGRASAPAQL